MFFEYLLLINQIALMMKYALKHHNTHQKLVLIRLISDLLIESALKRHGKHLESYIMLETV